jgi:hypothetical protein
VVIAGASASSSSQNNQNASMMPQYGQPQGGGPPAPQQMEAGRALGLWRSTFGAVKIEADNRNGGLQMGALQGVWVYNRQGQEVIGYFAGNLRGNVLQFRWNEPGANGAPPLNGEGWLQFDPGGRQYTGRWWTERRDRVGDWNGWRQGDETTPEPGTPQPGPMDQPTSSDPYGGQTYGQPSYSQPAPTPAPAPTQPPPADRRYY